MSVFQQEGNRLKYHYDAEELWLEPWGANSLRVRATKEAEMPKESWALLEAPECGAEIEITEDGARIKNGKIRAEVSKYGKITFYNQKGKLLLEEYSRTRKDLFAKTCSALEVEPREFKPILGGDYRLTVRFEAGDKNEKIYGMGQYQQELLNLKGADLELAHRNSQASVPFALSSLGYGFLWNNPAVGRCVFGANITSWEAESTKGMDYWITAGDTPAEIEEAYAGATGRVPMMPEYAMGFWQCKLRYQTQEELLQVAREYKRLGLPISVIVVDFFHWPKQGEWRFDPTYWPDPDGMIRELKEMGIELMVSIWPTVDRASENYEEMLENGYLIRCDRGVDTSFIFLDKNTLPFDATNPEARGYVWAKVKEHYYDAGVRLFWLDEAEPEYNIYDFDNYRYYSGPCLQTGNIYPSCYSQAFYDGMKAAGQTNIVNLVRCAWAGSARYGALVWSGDIHSDFDTLRRQVRAGLNMGVAGIPWWTTDIGGFAGGDPKDETFRELIVRWFEWGTFCPVMRLHGNRVPDEHIFRKNGQEVLPSGADNEIWSFGETAYGIIKKLIDFRELMRPYTRQVMQEAHESGAPVMRTMFYEFPEDARCWDLEDQYLFGSDVLVAPVCEQGAVQREVYLPAGAQWTDIHTGKAYDGGQIVACDCPLDKIPVFLKNGSHPDWIGKL